tara:strand:- start:295 stop:483 length:189 start_codon:yes stop_codon:yes gene_type:complete
MKIISRLTNYLFPSSDETGETGRRYIFDFGRIYGTAERPWLFIVGIISMVIGLGIIFNILTS